MQICGIVDKTAGGGGGAKLEHIIHYAGRECKIRNCTLFSYLSQPKYNFVYETRRKTGWICELERMLKCIVGKVLKVVCSSRVRALLSCVYNCAQSAILHEMLVMYV